VRKVRRGEGLAWLDRVGVQDLLGWHRWAARNLLGVSSIDTFTYQGFKDDSREHRASTDRRDCSDGEAVGVCVYVILLCS
jgi:hypothetical protein